MVVILTKAQRRHEQRLNTVSRYRQRVRIRREQARQAMAARIAARRQRWEGSMGTRADFYVGRGEQAEWIGSIAWDGYPEGLRDTAILTAPSEQDFRAAVSAELAKRDDATTPDRGWPWPWENSHTTDYAYAFDGGTVYASNFGHAWFKATEEQPDEDTPRDTVFPNMRTDRHAPAGTDRSGVKWVFFGR